MLRLQDAEESVRYKLTASILTIVCLIGAHASAQEVVEREAGVFATEKITIRKAVGARPKIQLAAAVYLSGTIRIATQNSDTLDVRYVKTAKAADRSQAIDFIDLISVVIEGRPGSPVVKMRAPNPAPWSGTDYSGQVEMEIIAPSDAEIEILASPFDVTTVGPLRALDIPESLGGMNISNITESLNLTTANRAVKLKDITGQISVVTSRETLAAEDITSLDDQARFRNDGGDIEIIGMNGSVNIKNTYGRIDIEGFVARGQSSIIRGSSRPIAIEVIEMKEGQLVVSNRQEDIEIVVPDTLSAFYSLSVDDDGIIEASNFPFTPDLVERNRLNLQSGDGRIDVSASVKGKGNIYIRGRSGE
jgi:hypothetical protein